MGLNRITLCWKVCDKLNVKVYHYILKKKSLLFSHTLRNINDWTIQLGITRRHSHSYYGEKVKIRRVIPHPQYNSEITHDNDIALFQVS